MLKQVQHGHWKNNRKSKIVPRKSLESHFCMSSTQQPLVLALVDNEVEIRAVTADNLVHYNLANNVVYFATRKIVLGSQFEALLFG